MTLDTVLLDKSGTITMKTESKHRSTDVTSFKTVIR